MTEESAASHSAPVRGRVSRFFGQYIVKNRFQFKFSFVIFLFLATAMTVIWLQGSWVVSRMISQGLVTGDEAISHLRILNQNILYLSVLALAVVFGLTLFFSHFIAGPLYRFEKTLEQMREGDLSVIVRLRKHDELKDTAECFNQALTSLRGKIRHDREVITVSLDKINKLIQQSRQEGKAVETDLLEKIVSTLQNTPPQIKI